MLPAFFLRQPVEHQPLAEDQIEEVAEAKDEREKASRTNFYFQVETPEATSFIKPKRSSFGICLN